MDSGEVNDYLREAMGEDFTAKDFRTWGGTLARSSSSRARRCRETRRAQRARAGGAQNDVVKQVADALGNTPAVCRKAYIDPAVFAGWRDGALQRAANGARGARQWEQAALRFLSARGARRRRSKP